MRSSTTLSINPTPFRPSLLSIPPSPFSPLSPLPKFPPFPSPHEPASSFSSSSSSASTDSLSTLSSSSSRSTSPSLDSPSRHYATPPPPNPLHWLWQCHLCRQTYALGTTRRCLEDGHFFCAGTTTVNKGSKKRQRKQNSACASEFDYVGWAAWGVWRRTVVSLLDSDFDRRGVMKGGFGHKTRSFQRVDAGEKKDCWNNCDYPSECRWGRTMIAVKLGEVSTANDASASMSERREERTMLAENDGAVQVLHEEYVDTSPTLEAFEDAIMELAPLSRVSSTAEISLAETPNASSKQETLPATTFDAILADSTYSLQPIAEWNAQQEALEGQQSQALSPLTNASAWAKKAKEDFWKSVIDSALLRRRLSGERQDAREEGKGLVSGMGMPVPLLGPFLGVPLSPVSEDDEGYLGGQKVGKTVRFKEVAEWEDVNCSDSNSSSSEEGEAEGEDMFSVGSDSDESCGSESSSDEEEMRDARNGEKGIRSPYLRTTSRSGR